MRMRPVGFWPVKGGGKLLLFKETREGGACCNGRALVAWRREGYPTGPFWCDWIWDFEVWDACGKRDSPDFLDIADPEVEGFLEGPFFSDEMRTY